MDIFNYTFGFAAIVFSSRSGFNNDVQCINIYTIESIKNALEIIEELDGMPSNYFRKPSPVKHCTYPGRWKKLKFVSAVSHFFRGNYYI